MTLLNQRIKIIKGEFKGKMSLIVSENENSLIADIKIGGQLETVELNKDFFDIDKYNQEIIISKEKVVVKNAIAEWRYKKICKKCKVFLTKIKHTKFNRIMYSFQCASCNLDYGGGWRKNKNKIPEGDWLPNNIPSQIKITHEVPGSKIQYEKNVKPIFEKVNKKNSIKVKGNSKLELIKDLNILSYESVQTFRRKGFVKLNELKALSVEKLMRLGNLSFFAAKKLESKIKEHTTKVKHTNIKIKNKTYLQKIKPFTYSKSKLNTWKKEIKSVKHKLLRFDEIILKFEKNKFNSKSLTELTKLNNTITKNIEIFDSLYNRYKKLNLESSYNNACDEINTLIQQINKSNLEKYNSIKNLERQIHSIIEKHNTKVILAKKLELKLDVIINNVIKLIKDNKLYDKTVLYYDKKIKEKNKLLKKEKISQQKKINKYNNPQIFRKKNVRTNISFLTKISFILKIIVRWIMIILICIILAYLFYFILN